MPSNHPEHVQIITIDKHACMCSKSIPSLECLLEPLQLSTFSLPSHDHSEQLHSTQWIYPVHIYTESIVWAGEPSLITDPLIINITWLSTLMQGIHRLPVLSTQTWLALMSNGPGPHRTWGGSVASGLWDVCKATYTHLTDYINIGPSID